MIVAPQFEQVASVGTTATSCVLLLSRLCLETLCFGCAILLYFLIINNHLNMFFKVAKGFTVSSSLKKSQFSEGLKYFIASGLHLPGP